MRKLHCVPLAMALAVAGPARAQEDTGFSLAVRAAYGVPFGGTTGATGDDFSQLVRGAVPLWLDAGYRVTRNLFLGAYFQYGVAFPGDDAKALFANATGSDVRVGAQIAFDFMPGASFAPWAGLGLGYEWVTVKGKETITGYALDGSGGAHGLDFLLQLGVDYRVSRLFSIGPFLAFTFGEFQAITASAKGTGPTGPVDLSTSQDIVSKAMHGWLQLGLKGTFDL